jgi:murein peptide amidase A
MALPRRTNVLGACTAMTLLMVLGGGVVSNGEPSRGGGQRHWEAANAAALARLQQPSTFHDTVRRTEAIGASAQHRTIRITELGEPSLLGKVLIFGCIHGTECEGRWISPAGGCPAFGASIFVVPNLNPDGFAARTRLNGRGVDLNRNFPRDWKPIGSRGSPQYSGPKPFSEPETQVAAHLIRWLHPKVTIWFHQQSPVLAGRGVGAPLVRAWGQSVPLARRFAHEARMPFRRLPWLAGTAPNWQNHRFSGTASFVVELPTSAPGEDPTGWPPDPILDANSRAIYGLAKQVAKRG